MPNESIHSTNKSHHTELDRLFRYAELLNFGEIHTKFDHVTGLRAIIAVHSLKHGPAIGGCRLVMYQTVDQAMEDALRLAQMMSYKAALSNLAHGGAKAVLMLPKKMKNRETYFEAFGDFVNSLNGRYITAVDSGTNPADMDIIARKTSFVTCTTTSGNSGDPSPHTALGVRRGIEAAVKFKLGRHSLEGIHVAIQGVGNVGYLLAKDLKACGAQLTVCDNNTTLLQRCVDELGTATCPPENIYDVNADVFSPCALGSILSLETIKRLKVSIVAGSANNQLAHHHNGTILHEHNILYCPDFVLNAGGLIYVAAIYDKADKQKAQAQVKDIYDTLMAIFERAKQENCPTSDIVDTMARERLK